MINPKFSAIDGLEEISDTGKLISAYNAVLDRKFPGHIFITICLTNDDPPLVNMSHTMPTTKETLLSVLWNIVDVIQNGKDYLLGPN
jgi:hypothetical protein